MATMPPLRRTARSLPIALLRARERVMGPIREILNESGISEQKFRVLRVVEESGPMEQTALAQQACLLLPSLTRMLRAMEEGDRIGLLLDLDQGSMTVYKNDERLGVMATGLSGEYSWAVSMYRHGSRSTRIETAATPSA